MIEDFACTCTRMVKKSSFWDAQIFINGAGLEGKPMANKKLHRNILFGFSKTYLILECINMCQLKQSKTL